jgi:hypothetical protein
MLLLFAAEALAILHPGWQASAQPFNPQADVEKHGVRFPVPGMMTLERDARGFYIQR